MRIICEDLVGDWIHHLALIILCKVQFDQTIGAQVLPSDRIGAMLEEPW